jgi:hypothetical protein
VTATETIALTVLFAAFAATMAWAEILTRRHIAICDSVDTSHRRKRRSF